MMRYFLNKRVFLSLLLLLLSRGAMADCSFISGTGYTATDSANISFPKVIVQRDTPVGTVVASVTSWTLSSRVSTSPFIQCTYETYSTQFSIGTGNFAPVSYGGQTLYQTGVTGFAFRIVTPGSGTSLNKYGTGSLPRTISNPWCTMNTSNWYRFCGASWGPTTLEIVKISSSTGSGPLTTGSIVQASIVGQFDVMNFLVSSGSIQTVACSVLNSNIQVNMNKTKDTDFSGAGSTSGATDFAINLNCDASTNVNLTVNAGSSGAAAATTGVLNLDNTGTDTASGVGVQLLYNSAPVALGTRMTIATTAADGAYDIPMTARYIQTGQSITPGIANANATFTMTYQ